MSRPNLQMRQPAGRKAISQAQNSEYIRNLQQQIYLLELETRYMKAGKKGGMGGSNGGKSQFFSTHSLNGAKPGSIAALDQQVDMDDEESASEMARAVATLRQSEQELKQKVEELRAERDDLKENLKAQIEKNSNDKEQLHGEIINARQKQDEIASEAGHLKISYERVSQEKEILEQQIVQFKNEAQSFKTKIQEQLDIHNHTRTSLEKVQSQCHSQQDKIKALEGTIEEINVNFYKKQIQELQYKLSNALAEVKTENLERQALLHHQEQMKDAMKQAIQKQTALEQELGHLRQSTEKETHALKAKKSKSAQEERDEQDLREDKVRMENEIKMLNIACESKERAIEELNLKIKNLEIGQLKTSEQILARKEKLDQVEQLARNRAHELIQLGQDKSMLQDELADSKNQQDRNEKRLKTLQLQNKALEAKLEQYQKESEQWKEFSSVIDKVEETGTNYIKMMQGIKSQMRQSMETNFNL